VELSESLLIHLRDEAYALLAHQALSAEIADREQAKANVATTKPRFAMLAGRKSREAYDRSMQTAEDAVAPLRDKLAQVVGICRWLQPAVRRDVSSYLASVSPDYCRLLQIHARLDDWERSYRQLPEAILAFARDLREVRQAAEKKPAPFAHELASLRESAEGLARVQHELFIIEQAALLQAPATIAERIQFPTLPDLKRVPWVGRIAVLAPERVIAEVSRVEAEFRGFLAGPDKEMAARLKTCREVCAKMANQALEDYWNVLRAHARSHYVEECGVDQVIEMLNERYVDPEIRQLQESITTSPFTGR